MSKANPVAPEVLEDRTQPRTLGPHDGGNTLFAAWDKFYHIFGMRFTEVQVVPDGVVLVNLTMPDNGDLDLILADTARYSHRLDLPTCYPWLTQAPEKPSDSLDISVWQTQWFGGAGGGKKGVPQYVLNVANDYRAENDLGRGSSKKLNVAHIDPSNFDPKAFEGIDSEDLIMFYKAVDQAINARKGGDMVAV